MNVIFILSLLLVTILPSSGKMKPAKPASTTLTLSVLKPPIKKAISEVSQNGFRISYRLVAIVAVNDTVIDKIYTEDFKQGEGLSRIQARFIEKMQDDINSFQRAHTIYNSVAYTNTATTIQTNLNGVP